MNYLSLIAALALSLVSLSLATTASAADISGYAFVQDDGSLRISGRNIRLFGIYIPPTAQSCRRFERPVTCAPQAALALDFKIGADFVHCEPKSKSEDGSDVALCRVGEVNLSVYLLERGWALALPDAPFEYAALEKIARHKGIGVWGLAVERAR
jgi:endonuclease YncB( thermonuclease family)